MLVGISFNSLRIIYIKIVFYSSINFSMILNANINLNSYLYSVIQNMKSNQNISCEINITFKRKSIISYWRYRSDYLLLLTQIREEWTENFHKNKLNERTKKD